MSDINDTYIKCPKCGREKGLSLRMSVQFVSVTIPVTDGKPDPAYELLLEPLLATDKTLLRYSDVDRKSRFVFHRENMETLIKCPQCKQLHTLPKGIKIKCNDAG